MKTPLLSAEPLTGGATSPIARRRLGFLDSLRGLAAVYVLIYHMLLLPQPNLIPPQWAEKAALAGGTGVTLFFIVSAFSLYYTMSLRLRDPSPTLSFYLHRFFRIAPLFYFLILVTMIRDAWKFDVVHPWADVAASFSFVFNLWPGKQEGFVWAGWTIGVEMVFYAIFPLIYARVKSTGNAVAFIFFCLLAWLAIQLALDYLVMPDTWKQSILQWSTFKHFPVFATGILVYHVYMSMDAGSVHSGNHRGLGNALLWAGIFGFCALLQGWLPNVFGDGYYWQGVVFGCMFMGLALAPWPLIVNPVTAFLGKVSYSIYLTHTTAIFFMSPVYQRVYAQIPSLTLAFLVSLLLTLAVVLPISYLTYRLIEEPGIALGRKFASRLMPSQSHAGVAAQSEDKRNIR
jgi:peptidoglycan/LPS O-acetylase OafA/YrhL